MKKLKIAAILAVVLTFVAGLSAPTLADPIIEVVPMTHDFGDVQVGTSSTTIITVSNVGDHPLRVDAISLHGSSDFAITSMPELPVYILPQNGLVNSIDFEVAFTPSATGDFSTVLEITSNDLANTPVLVNLGGEGIDSQPTPVTIEDIIEFFDESVEAGTLEGRGSGWLAKLRLCIMREMLVIAGELIEYDRINAACFILQRAYLRSDGQKWPQDFVVGDDCPELNTMILELIVSLCGEGGMT